ncbi:MAG TPA: outer membrane protein assembly factor BamA, partial [Candidatus Cloacimonas sp.]|nr:outer membrane protein assembly factor BamA [Candidatus Cloacimonas sp.]
MRRIILSSILILLLVCLVQNLFAAGETIYDIKVIGAENIDPELVITALSIRIGDTLDSEAVAKSIRNLYKMGIFSDIQVESEPYRTGITLLIKIKENPIVSNIEYIGFKAVKQERIDELVNVKVGSYWSEGVKNHLVNKLKNEYATKGFSNAEIQIFESRLPNNKVGLKIQVNEGKKVSIKQITFVGNSYFEDKTLQKKMKTKPASFLRSGNFEQEKFDADLQALTAFYKKNGFIDVVIGPYEIQPLGEKHIEIVINVYEGTKYNFGGITIEGNEFFPSDELKDVFTMKIGEPFDQEVFDNELRNVYSKYFDEGFIYVFIVPNYVKEGDQLIVNLKINENNRARIRQIHITGNKRTKEKVIRRQLEISPGDYFRQTQVMRSQQNIYNLGFFEQDIRLDYTPVNKEGDIDLQLDVIDRSSGTANGGVGYNSQDKFVGQLSVSQNNLFGNNWSANLTWEFGGNTQNFEFGFTNPNLLDTDILLGSNLYYTKKTWSSF